MGLPRAHLAPEDNAAIVFFGAEALYEGAYGTEGWAEELGAAEIRSCAVGMACRNIGFVEDSDAIRQCGAFASSTRCEAISLFRGDEMGVLASRAVANTLADLGHGLFAIADHDISVFVAVGATALNSRV